MSGAAWILCSLLLIWPFVVPSVIAVALDVKDVESVFLLWNIFTTAPIIALTYISAEKGRRRKENDRMTLQIREEALQSRYREIVAGWDLTNADVIKIVPRSTDDLFKMERESWYREKRIEHLSAYLAKGHAEFEYEHGWMKLTCLEYIQKNKDAWILSKKGTLYPHYRQIVDYWVPSMNQVRNDACVPDPEKHGRAYTERCLQLYDLKTYNSMLDIIQSKEAEKISVLAAEEEYASLALQKNESDKQTYAPRPNKTRERAAVRVDRSLDEIKCPRCGAIQDSSRSFCYRCGAVFIGD